MLDLSVDDRVAFVYATKAGKIKQEGIVQPSDPKDATSPAIGVCRTSQKSQGTGRKQERFIRVMVNWQGIGIVTRNFNLPKILGTIQKVSQ